MSLVFLFCHYSNDLIRPLHKREQERGRERGRPLHKSAQGRRRDKTWSGPYTCTQVRKRER